MFTVPDGKQIEKCPYLDADTHIRCDRDGLWECQHSKCHQLFCSVHFDHDADYCVGCVRKREKEETVD